MARYRTVEGSLWANHWFLGLDPQARLYWLFIVTNPHTEPSGLYRLSPNLHPAYTGVESSLLEDYRKAFQSVGKAFFEDDWVLVPGYIDHQPTPNTNVWRAIVSQVEAAPKCLLSRWLSKNYGRVPKGLRNALPSVGEGIHLRLDNTRLDNTRLDDTKQDETINAEGREAEASSTLPYDEIKETWNDVFADSPIPLIRSFGDKRRRKLRARWAEWSELGPPINVFRQICEYMATDPFHRGKNPRKWRASIDYLIRNDAKWRELYERALDHEPTEEVDYI